MRRLKKLLTAGLLYLPATCGFAGHYFLGGVGGAGWMQMQSSSQDLVFHLPKTSLAPHFLFLGGNNKTVPVFGLTSGYQWDLTNRFSLQSGVSVLHFSHAKNQGVAIDGNASSDYRNFYSYKTSSTAMLMDIRLAYKLGSWRHPWWCFVPFIRGSFGYAVNQARDFKNSDTNPSQQFTFDDNLAGDIAYGGGLGIMKRLGTPIMVSLEYDYWSLGNAKFSKGRLGTRLVTSTDLRTPITGQTLLLSILYRFDN